MTTTRYLCPLDCGWHHDQDDADRNFDFGPFAGDRWAPGTDPIAAVGAAARLLASETAVRAHMESHSLVEWVTAVSRLQRERDGLRIRVAQLEAMRRAECPERAPEDDCPCCTYGNHTEACRCDGQSCCHPERHREKAS